MTDQHHRDQVENTTLLLDQARWLLDRAHQQLCLLGDITAAHAINCIIGDIETEWQHWLHAVDSPYA